MIRHHQGHNRRHNDFAPRKSGEPLLNTGDSVHVQRHQNAQFGLGQYLDIWHLILRRHVNVFARDDPVVQGHVNVTATQQQGRRAVRRNLARQKRSDPN